MANCILILGESGTGKSTSIRNLDPKETCIINITGKSLPFKGWKSGYSLCTKENPEGNMAITDKSDSIIKMLRYFAKRDHVRHIIVDDFQYNMSFDFMRRLSEKGYEKFTQLAQNYWNIINEASELRKETNHLNVYFMSHIERDASGHEKIKTVGKMLDSLITIEGLFMYVLYTYKDENGFWFMTENNGNNTCKVPMGIFPDKLIPNDLAYLAKAIEEYEK